MRELLKKIGYLVILLAPLDAFKILGGYFSLYRLALVFLLTLTLIDIVSVGKSLINRRSFFWIILFESTNVIAILISKNIGLGISFFLNDTLGVLIVFLFIYIYSCNDIDSLLLFYVRSQYVVLGFSIYGIFIHVMGRDFPTNISFGGISFSMSVNQLELLARSKSFLPQLFMPYATTLHLEYSVGIAALICLYFYIKNNRKQFLLLAICFSLLILLSAQKGPIIAFVIALLVYMNVYRRNKGLGRMMLAVVIIIAFAIVCIANFGQEIIRYTVLRFLEFGDRMSGGTDRHILLVYEAFRIWTYNIRNFFIGIGYSSAAMKEGYYTFIPETFLCTYATLLAERGLLGTITVLFYIRNWKYVRKTSRLLYNILLFVLVSFLFYELRYLQTSWIVLSIFMISSEFDGCNYSEEAVWRIIK